MDPVDVRNIALGENDRRCVALREADIVGARGAVVDEQRVEVVGREQRAIVVWRIPANEQRALVPVLGEERRRCDRMKEPREIEDD